MQELHAGQALTPEGWVAGLTITIDAGRIARLSREAPAPGAQKVDLLLPAPVNLHSHAFQRAMAGLTETRGPDPSDTSYDFVVTYLGWEDKVERPTPEEKRGTPSTYGRREYAT